MVDRVDVSEIKKSLYSLGLSIPAPSEILTYEAEIVKAAHPSLHKYLCDPKLKKTKARIKPLYDLVMALGLKAYFDIRYPLDTLFKVLQGVEVRAAIEALCLSHILAEEVVTLINRRWGYSLTKEDLQHYKDLFWDTEAFDVDSWVFHLAQCKPKEQLLKSFALAHPEEMDKLKWLAGLPVDLDYTVLLNKVMTDAYYHLDKALDPHSMVDPAAANTLSGIMVRVGDRLKKFGTGSSRAAVEGILRIFTENRQSGSLPRPAPIHIGVLPDVETTGKVISIATKQKEKEE